jgi:undecaprenyl-diphosphatase
MSLTLDPSMLPGDRSAFLHVNAWARDSTWLHGATTAYAQYGVVLFAGLLLAGYLLARRAGSRERVAASLWAPLAALLAVALNQPIAHGVAEPRPFTVYPDALVLAHRSADASFASDHATMAGAVGVALLLVSRRIGLLASGAAVLMAMARVYVGVHFPVDVVAGLLLGGLTAGGGWLLGRGVLLGVLDRLARSPLRGLVG